MLRSQSVISVSEIFNHAFIRTFRSLPLAFAAAVLLATGTLSAQGKDVPAHDSLAPRQRAALIFGERHALTMRAPEQWVLDTRSGKAQGLQAVFYPQGEKWAKSPAVMYCQVMVRGGDIANAAAMVNADQQRFRNASPSAVVAAGDSIPLNNGRHAVTWTFSGGARGTFERVAYIEERTVIVLVVLSCRNPEALDRSLPAFWQLVRSYQFLADDHENILRAVEAAEEFMD